MNAIRDRHAELLLQFVEAFSKLGDLTVLDRDFDVPPEVSNGVDDSPWARRLWKPVAIATPASALEEVYRHAPRRFPPLYEELVLSYRWLNVHLRGAVELFANPPGDGLAGLLSEMTRDSAITNKLFAHGFLHFGKADDCYDPICFDTRSPHADGDCSIVQVDHEAILSESRIGHKWPIAHSFHAFVEDVIEKAGRI